MVGDTVQQPGFDICLVIVWHERSHCLSWCLCQKDLWLQFHSSGRKHQCNSYQSSWKSCSVLMRLQRWHFPFSSVTFGNKAHANSCVQVNLVSPSQNSLEIIGFHQLWWRSLRCELLYIFFEKKKKTTMKKLHVSSMTAIDCRRNNVQPALEGGGGLLWSHAGWGGSSGCWGQSPEEHWSKGGAQGDQPQWWSAWGGLGCSYCFRNWILFRKSHLVLETWNKQGFERVYLLL